MSNNKIRLDLLLTTHNLADSRSKAQELIKSGLVYVDGVNCTKPSEAFSETAIPEIRGEVCRYVSRGGLKLEKALDQFHIDPTGFVCSDSGASTGGFTDCLLQNGAAKVFAIDVGTNQLVDKIRMDPRVVPMEQTNIRYVTPDDIGEPLDLSVIDVSFISLQLVLPAVYQLLKDNGHVVCLIKPQFEAGKAFIGKKGVVKDPKVHKRVLDAFLESVSAMGFSVLDLTFSPIKGPEGNIEFLGHLIKGNITQTPQDTAALVSQAHAYLKG